MWQTRRPALDLPGRRREAGRASGLQPVTAAENSAKPVRWGRGGSTGEARPRAPP